MIKRITVLFSTLIIICAALGGCSGKPENISDARVVQAYYDELTESYFEYVGGSSLSMAPEAVKANVEARTSGLARFDKMTPPPEFAVRHAEIMKASEKEHDWNTQLGAYANGGISYDELLNEKTRIFGEGRLMESEFTTKILEMGNELYNDPRTTASEEQEKLQVLYQLFS